MRIRIRIRIRNPGAWHCLLAGLAARAEEALAGSVLACPVLAGTVGWGEEKAAPVMAGPRAGPERRYPRWDHRVQYTE
jgi:hypothetical protein